MDKSLTYIADRQKGKTTFLAQCIANHLTDPRIPEGTVMVAFGVNYEQTRNLLKAVQSKLMPGEASISTHEMITANGKKVLFRSSVKPVKGLKVDYVFMDNTELMSDEFKASIDILRGNTIVIETTGTMTE